MSKSIKPVLKRKPIDSSNVTVVEVRYDEKIAISESNKLRIVIDNFDKILDEYKQPPQTKIPKLQKSKTCSIIESKCVLKKTSSVPLAASSMHDLNAKSLSRTVSSCDVSVKKSKIPVMSSLRKTFPSTPSGLNLTDRQKASVGKQENMKSAKSVQNLVPERRLGGRFAKSTQNLNKPVALSMPKRRDYVGKSLENVSKSTKRVGKVEEMANRAVKSAVQKFESKTFKKEKSDLKGTYKKHNAVTRTSTYTKTPKLKIAKQLEEPVINLEKCDVLTKPLKATEVEIREEKKTPPPPPPKNKIIALISNFERKSTTTTSFTGYTSDNSDDSGNISNEHELDCDENSVLVSSRLNSSSDESLLLSPDDSGIEKTPEKVT